MLPDELGGAFDLFSRLVNRDIKLVALDFFFGCGCFGEVTTREAVGSGGGGTFRKKSIKLSSFVGGRLGLTG